MSSLRKATEKDVDSLGYVLGRAFEEDPVWRAILPDERQRREALPKLFHSFLRVLHLPFDEVYTTGDLAGASLWSPPGKWRVGLLTQARLAAGLVSVFGRRAIPALGTLSAMQERHPTEPHWYLAVIGTDPSHQGRGVGGTLLEPVLARCDREAMPAYLESSNPLNVDFYRRHGFETTETIETPVGRPVTAMWRKPRRRAS
jgi:ribosomal protein S18 acetylase RimI-like enzyme